MSAFSELASLSRDSGGEGSSNPTFYIINHRRYFFTAVLYSAIRGFFCPYSFSSSYSYSRAKSLKRQTKAFPAVRRKQLKKVWVFGFLFFFFFPSLSFSGGAKAAGR